MSPELEERLVVAFERIADVMVKRFEIDHPEPVEPPPAEVYNTHDEKEQPDSKEAYEKFQPGEGRYSALIAAAAKARA